MKIYLVQGSSGMHDDYSHWIVKAFFDKNKAEKLVEECQKEADRIEKAITEHEKKYYTGSKSALAMKDPLKYWDEYTELTQSHKLDPNFEYDSECRYYIDEIEVEGEPPKE